MELNFQDYSPKGDTTSQDDSTEVPQIQIRIPDASQHSRSAHSPLSASSSSVLSALQNVVNLSSSTGLSEEALRQMVASAGKQRQSGVTTGATSYWGLGYFAQYFDVTTSEVLQRIIWSALPLRAKGVDVDTLNEQELTMPLSSSPGPNLDDNTSQIFTTTKQRSYSYIERFIQSRPDLYGPFWISTTLVFAVAIFSNIVSFYNHRSKIERLSLESISSSQGNINKTIEEFSSELGIHMDNWHYSMDELNLATSVVMMYIIVVPTLLWFLFWIRGCTKYYTLAETICAYGYSMSIFVPVSALSMIQSSILMNLSISAASTLSGLVLTMSFLPITKTDPSPGGSRVILAIVPACTYGFAYILHRIMLQ